MQVKIVNHGKAFGGDKDWFTFYCGKCGHQLGAGTLLPCPECGTIPENKEPK